MAQQKEYYAFISYKREDEKWAKWLQDKLEHYKFPTNLNGRSNLPKNIRPTFRDVTDMKPGFLVEEINNALNNSEWLIVVCSPRSAKSPWVCKEAQTFIDLGRVDHIIPFVIEGFPFSNDIATECYPEALLSLTGTRELLAANVNEIGRDAAAIKVVARMFNLRFDFLWQRHEREQKLKRWMWIIVAILISLLGLGIGGYFVRQNGIIERQNERLQQDSITMANHLKRIQNDSIMLSVQNDSIASQNSIILNQRDSIENSMKRLYLSNRLLYRERDNVVRANASLSLSLMKTYLSQNMPEMALVVLNDTECNIELDSEQISDLKILKESLCDSILTSSTLLVNIIDTLERRNLDCAALLKTKEVVDFQHVDDTDFLYIHNTENNTTDTISGDPTLNFISNLGMTFIAVYQDGEQGINNLDTVFNCEKAGIRIFSLQTGKLEHFIGCWAWFPWMTYPMSLSNDGKSLIYHEEYRAFERIWFVNFDKGQRIPLYSSNSNSDDDYVISSFSPSGEWFYLNFPAKNKIEIYSSWSLKEIRTFRYEDCDSVYWDISNNICISSRGKIYTWKLLGDNKNCIFSVGSFANSVNISNKYAAVACNDGKTYVWDIILKKMIFAKEIIDAPEDVAIADGNKILWVVSKYDGVKTIDFENNLIKSINYESGVPNAFNNPWLYMTKDGLYCICLNQNYYAIFDMKGNLIKQGILSGEVDENINRLLSEVYRPDEFCYDPELTNSKLPVLTARRVSSNGEICIEGYSNGVIKIVSIKDRNRIYSLIGGFTESCKNRRIGQIAG